jgi:hypothetical protein
MAQEKTGDTRVARWKDDRTAVYLLMFDDGWPSQWQVAGPELAKRGMTGTFYINPDKGEYKQFGSKWSKDMTELGMVFANHTMTHRGVKDLENARWEIMECTKIIRTLQPGKEGRLVSYGQPGVAADAWKISGAELKGILEEDHLISRPPFTDHGAVYHLKTLDSILALVDKAIANKGMEYLVVHGVERIEPNWGFQDMWPFKQDIFFPLLDALKEKSDRGELWITDHISQHKYETERNGAEVVTAEAGDQVIRTELKSKADPELYDLPLTLVTRVPATWKKAVVVQGETKTAVTVSEGLVRYDALPNGPAVEIRPVIE